LRLFLKNFDLVPGVPEFWARGGEGALTVPPRATGLQPNFGRIKFFIFFRLAAAASRPKPPLATEPGCRKWKKNEKFKSTCGCCKWTNHQKFGPPCGCRKWEKMKNLSQLAAAASGKKM